MISHAFTVTESPSKVFAAINDVRAWWSGEIDGPTDELGGQFEYRYQDFHRSVQKITELQPGKKIVWHVVDAQLKFVDNQTEWNGTDIVFEIGKKDGKTEVRFTHGLAPACQCYRDCNDAWGFYVKESLRSLITTGKGKPNSEE